VGTPWYCSPEIVKSEEYGPKTDVWSIGCSTIELVTGKPPFDDLNDVACLFKVAEGNPPPLPTDVSPECADFLSKCLNPKQEERPSGAELLEHPFLQLSQEDWALVEADIKALVSEMNELRDATESESSNLSSSK
jgi:serine/threonine protein kinase